jgi:polar amino acid transport system substrate-binding protein
MTSLFPSVRAALLRAFLAVALLLPALVIPAHAQGPAIGAPASRLVVGTMRMPPFVLRNDDGKWSGLSIELWTQIAGELNTPFEFREYDYDAAGLLDAVERRQIDLAIGVIPVTAEGETRFDFSHPYYAAGLGIAVRAEPQRGVLAALAGFLTPQALTTLTGLLGVLLLVGVLIWLLERGRNAQQFDPHPARGIGDGLWWAAVTMTTTGYGDQVPISRLGRALGLLWMLASIFIISFRSATMASSFVVNRLKVGIASPADLPRARVAVVSGTAGEQWGAEQGLRVRSYPFVIQASKALQRGDVEALVYERAILGHMIKQYGWGELHVLPHILAVRDYAIALPADSPLKETVNRALLKVVHRSEWKNVVQRYVGTTDPAGSADQP